MWKSAERRSFAVGMGAADAVSAKNKAAMVSMTITAKRRTNESAKANCLMICPTMIIAFVVCTS